MSDNSSKTPELHTAEPDSTAALAAFYGRLDSLGGCLDAHSSGPDTIWIDMFSIPRDARRKGLGSSLWAEFESALPPCVERILVFAADTGSGNTDGFWEAVGFEYLFLLEPEEELSYEAKHTMQKTLTRAARLGPLNTKEDQPAAKPLV